MEVAATAAAERARAVAEYAEREENKHNLVKRAEKLANYLVSTFGDHAEDVVKKGVGVFGVVALFAFAYAVYYLRRTKSRD